MNSERLGLAETFVCVRSGPRGTLPAPQIQAPGDSAVLAGRDVLGLPRPAPARPPPSPCPFCSASPRRCHATAAGGDSCLVLAPTRELACANRRQFPRLRPQHRPAARGRLRRRRRASAGAGALNAGVDVLVATPGRLLDLMQQGFVDLRASKSWCSTRPTGCSTWASSTTCGGSWPSRRSGRRCSSRPPCRPTSSHLADAMAPRPGRLHGRAALSLRRTRSSSPSSSSTGQESSRCWRIGCTQTRLDADARLHADQARRRPRRRGCSARPASRPTPSTATRANRPGSARCPRSRTPQPAVLVATDIAARGHRRRRHLPRDQLRSCPTIAEMLRPPHRPHGRAGAAGWPFPSAIGAERATLQAIERLTRQTLFVEAHPTGAAKTQGDRAAGPPSFRPRRAKRPAAFGPRSRPRS